MTEPLDARQLLRKHGLRAKKSWGQNFLVEERAYREIVEACAVSPEDWVIEIGAGLGTLTARLAARAGKVVAIERDRDMVAVLRAELGDEPRVELAEANALTFDFAAVAERASRAPVVVGNLPYQIASPILFRLLEVRHRLRRIVVMLQKEMADRVVARPDTSAYGALSVMVQSVCAAKLMCRVRAGAFLPPPRVDSAVVRLEPLSIEAAPDLGAPEWFSRVVHAAFGQRRKTLRNALRALVDETVLDPALERLGLDPRRRGETLSVEEFAALARQLRPGDA